MILQNYAPEIFRKGDSLFSESIFENTHFSRDFGFFALKKQRLYQQIFLANFGQNTVKNLAWE